MTTPIEPTAAERDALAVLAEVCKVPVAELTPDRHLIRDLELDSVRSLELLMTLEERLATEISELDAAKLVTIADLLAFVRARS